jgi:zinc transport system permease protein
MNATVMELLVAAAMAAAAGFVGSIAVVRRMALASDALSHVALPGIGIALLLHLNPLVGGLAALLIGTVLVWAIEYESRLPTEAVIGVIFSGALAVGAMLTSGEELIDALFGGVRAVTTLEAVAGLVIAAAVIVFVIAARSRLVIRLVSADLARTTGIRVARLDLAFLLAFAVTVALGLRFLGVLLMGSLIIVPAATAMRLARTLGRLQAVAVATAVGATLAGSVLAPRLHVAAGPLTIVFAAGFFVVTLLVRQRV